MSAGWRSVRPIVMDRKQQSQTVHPGYHMMTPDVPAEEDYENFV